MKCEIVVCAGGASLILFINEKCLGAKASDVFRLITSAGGRSWSSFGLRLRDSRRRGRIKVGSDQNINIEPSQTNFVLPFENLVDANNPMFGSESLLHSGKFNVLVANFTSSCSVKSRGLTVLCWHLTEFIVAQFVSYAVEQGGWSAWANIKATRSHEITLIRHIVGEYATSNSDRPKEFIDVVRRVTRHATKNH